MSTEPTYEEEKEVVEKLRQGRTAIDQQLRKVIVGQQEVIEQLLIALFSGGH